MSNLDSLIEKFSPEKLQIFLRGSIPTFYPDDDDLQYLFAENNYDKYKSIVKIGEAEIGQVS